MVPVPTNSTQQFRQLVSRHRQPATHIDNRTAAVSGSVRITRSTDSFALFLTARTPNPFTQGYTRKSLARSLTPVPQGATTGARSRVMPLKLPKPGGNIHSITCYFGVLQRAIQHGLLYRSTHEFAYRQGLIVQYPVQPVGRKWPLKALKNPILRSDEPGFEGRVILQDQHGVRMNLRHKGSEDAVRVPVKR